MQHQFNAPDDGRQKVVEIMGDISGQLADRFHLLRLAQRLVAPLKLGGTLDDARLQFAVQVLQ